MATLDQAVKSGIKILEGTVEYKIKEIAKNNSSKVWKGKKIVSIQKWNSLKKQGNSYNLLDYMLDDHIEHPFYDLKDDQLTENDRELWCKDYFEFLEIRKNRGLGKTLCDECMLHPKCEIKSPSVRDVILKGISDNNRKITFPCKVVNIFECPYMKEEKDASLFDLKNIEEITCNALGFANTRTKFDNSDTIQANFENNTAIYRDDCPLAYERDNLTSLLKDFRLSKVPVKDIKDAYKVLTNREKLNAVLELYIESVADDYRGEKKRTPTSEEKAAKIREWKSMILDFFSEIKNKIKPEDLRDVCGQTPEFEEYQIKIRKRDLEEEIARNPERFEIAQKMERSGSCVSCSGFANINCIHCNIWVCDKHWKEHAISKHSMKLEINELN